jgi:hypothetical protein
MTPRHPRKPHNHAGTRSTGGAGGAETPFPPTKSALGAHTETSATPRHPRHPDVPRLAYSPDEAARALGCSRDFLDEHVAPELRWVRRGRRKFVAVAELSRWLEASAARTLEGAP